MGQEKARGMINLWVLQIETETESKDVPRTNDDAFVETQTGEVKMKAL